jgi:hypothetical protein
VIRPSPLSSSSPLTFLSPPAHPHGPRAETKAAYDLEYG